MPQLPGGAALLAVSIVGATVMPHVIYLHSALVRGRVPAATATAERRRIFRFEIVDVLCAMGLAGLINLAMLAIAAAVFFSRGDTSAGSDLGRVVAGLNGFVGGARGHGVRRGAAGLRDRVLLRRHHVRPGGDGGLPAPPHPGVPAPRRHHDPGLVVLAVGFSPTRALVLSQVFLSFGIPFALIPLVAFTAKRSVMGALVNRRVTTLAAVAVTAVIVSLNVYLLATA